MARGGDAMKQHLLGIGLAMALVAAGPVEPPKHLVPEDSALSQLAHPGTHLTGGLHIFEPVFDESVRIFMLGEPAFTSRYVIGLKQIAKGFKIFGARPTRPSRANPGPLTLDRCEAPVDTALARQVIAAWDAVVQQTRPRVGVPWSGNDGSHEHFASRLKYGVVTGQLWSPQRPWNPGWLSRIAYDLHSICTGFTGGFDPWAEMRHAVGQINLKSAERVPWRAR
jgi:hypothetical protein